MSPHALLLVLGVLWLALVAALWRLASRLEAVERRLGGGGFG